jgi:hypothetical protein
VVFVDLFEVNVINYVTLHSVAHRAESNYVTVANELQGRRKEATIDV